MATKLPHFGELVERVRASLEKVLVGLAIADSSETLSEGTVLNISSGKVIKERTWEDYGSAFVDVLIGSDLFPFRQTDRERLLRSFLGYRHSYEELNEMLSKVQADQEIIYRAVLRLTFLDLGIRYAGLCLWTGKKPDHEIPLWAQENGGNEFWRALLEKLFPGMTLVGAKDEDCSSKIGMTGGQMRHCLYDNAYPGADYLNRLLPDRSEFAAALRHYCAFRMCRDLAQRFGKFELACWIRDMVDVAASLVEFIRQFDDQISETQRRNFIWAMLTGGIGDSRVAGLILRFPQASPDEHRIDLIAMARNEPFSVISQYVEFCLHAAKNKPADVCWETGYQQYIKEFQEFKHTKQFPDGRQPSPKLKAVTEAHDQENCEAIFAQINIDHPEDAEAHQIYGQELERSGKLEMAWAEYEIAVALNPVFQLPLFALADSKSRVGRHKEALAVVERINDDGVGPGSRAYIRAIILIRANKFLEVIPNLIDAYKNGYELGTCASVLSWFFGRLAHHSNEASKQQRHWQKIARHHGMTAEIVMANVKALELD